jgi:ABC-2 type transport system permease protein
MKKILNYIILTFEVVKLNILSAMEYRVAFLTQVVGMIMNDCCWLYLWYLFFTRFPSINGWGLHDTLILFSFNMANYGLYKIFTDHSSDIAHDVAQGNLDFYMTLPKSVLWQVSTSTTAISALGDFIFGVVLFLLLGFGWVQFLLYLLLCILTAVIYYNVTVILQSMAFFLGNFEETAERIFNLVMGLTFYPATAFSGVLKFLTFTFLPVFFMVWLPVDIMKLFSWTKVGMVAGFALLTFGLAVWIFNRGLKRYESGNLINVKM